MTLPTFLQDHNCLVIALQGNTSILWHTKEKKNRLVAMLLFFPYRPITSYASNLQHTSTLSWKPSFLSSTTIVVWFNPRSSTARPKEGSITCPSGDAILRTKGLLTPRQSTYWYSTCKIIVTSMNFDVANTITLGLWQDRSKYKLGWVGQDYAQWSLVSWFMRYLGKITRVKALDHGTIRCTESNTTRTSHSLMIALSVSILPDHHHQMLKPPKIQVTIAGEGWGYRLITTSMLIWAVPCSMATAWTLLS